MARLTSSTGARAGCFAEGVPANDTDVVHSAMREAREAAFIIEDRD
jgi:hypothetical protein